MKVKASIGDATVPSGGEQQTALASTSDLDQASVGWIESWPLAIRTTVERALASPSPTVVWLGREMVTLHNAAFRTLIATHGLLPIGVPGYDLWPRSWPTVAPKLARVIDRGETVWLEDEIFLSERSALGEARYFTLCCMPLADGDGRVVGIIAPVTETTQRVIGKRLHSRHDGDLRAVINNSHSVIFLKDIAGRYQLVNRRFCEAFGLTEEAVIGKSDADLFEPGYASLYRAHDLDVQRAGRALEFEEPARYRDKAHVNIVNKFPVFDAWGEICAVGCIATDITERKRAEELIHALAHKQSAIARLSERALASADLGDLLRHAVSLLVETLKVDLANVLELLPGGNELLLREGIGWHPSYIGNVRVPVGSASLAGYALTIGRPVDERGLRTTESVFVEDWASEARFKKPLQLHSHGVVSSMSTVIYGADHPYGVMSVHTVNRRAFSQNEAWFLQSVANVVAAAVQRAASEQELRRSEGRLAEAQRLAHLGSWESDLATGRLACSDEFYRILGLAPEDFAGTYEALMERVSGEDRSRLREAVQCSLAERTPFSLELRVVRPKGDIRILQTYGRPRIGPHDSVLGVIGVCVDITERRLAEAAVLETEKRFQMVADAAPIMIWMAGRDRTCTYVNRSWLEFTGRTREQESAVNWVEDIHPADVVQCLATYETAVDQRAPFTVEYRLRRHDGAYRWVLDQGVPCYDADKTFAGYVGSCIDIDELVQLERVQAIHHATMGTIANTRDIGETYRGALAAVCEQLGWPVGQIWVVTPDGGTLQHAASWHGDDPSLDAFIDSVAPQRFMKGEGFPGRVWAEGRPVFEFDMAEAETFHDRRAMLAVGLRSAIGFPILGEGGVVGVMIFMSNALKTIAPATEKALSALAAQVHAVAMQRAAEQRLRESDERFRLLVEGVRDYSIYMLDPEGRVISWNSGAEQIEGYRAHEILGQPFARFYTPRDIAAGKPKRDLAVARARGRLQDEGWRVRKDGAWFWASVVITATRDASGALRGYSKLTRDMTERKRAEQDLLSYADRLRALSNRLVEVQESERRRIAAELHDRVGQTFTALSINLNILKTQLHGDGGAESSQTRLDDCLALVEWTVEGIREVMAELRPVVLDDYGLPAALRWYAEQFESRTGIATRVSAEASISRLAPAAEAAIFRIAQEALTNIAKHANAATVNVHLLSNARAVSLTVVDDGAGFDPKPGPMGEHSGWGLMIMRERAEALGGWFSLESAPGQGTRIEITIPRETVTPRVGADVVE